MSALRHRPVRHDLRVTTPDDTPPDGYVEPIAVWCVEGVDPREPDEGPFQFGAFTAEREAETLKRRLESEGFFAELRINSISVYRRAVDYEWDR